MERLDTILAGRDYVGGAAFSIADITAYCTVDFAKWAKVEVPGDAADLQRWFAAIGERPSASL